MKILHTLLMAACLTAGTVPAQDTFTITGTAIPSQLLKLNYGTMPKGIAAYDINICNTTEVKHPLTSSQIYQALMESKVDLRPIGRQIMLAVILRNQNHSLRTWLTLGLGSTTSVLSILGQGRITSSTSGAFSTLALGALVGQQLLATWSPVLTADQVEKFEAQVLESALIMDGGSCVERTIFTTVAVTSKKVVPSELARLQFHVH